MQAYIAGRLLCDATAFSNIYLTTVETGDKMIVAASKILFCSIINSYAVFFPLISLHTHGCITHVGVSPFLDHILSPHWYLKQHVPTKTVLLWFSAYSLPCAQLCSQFNLQFWLINRSECYDQHPKIRVKG